MAKRRVFSRIKVARIGGARENPLGEIANEHNISPNQLRIGKRNFLKMPQVLFLDCRDDKELRAKE